jgi:hypothetical protein
MNWTQRITPSRTARLVIAVGLIGTVVTGVAVAASPSTAYKACSTKKHVLALASSKGKCHAGSTKVTIGARGPKGAPGAAGTQGVQGDQGDQGVQGDQGPAGPDLPGYLDFVTSPSFTKGNNDVTIATLSLPKGTFMITADVDLHGDLNSSAIPDVTCSLDAGLDQNTSDVTVPAGSGYVGVSLVAAATFVGAGNATIVCNNHNTAVFAANAQIMATPAGSVNYATS